MIQAVGVMKNTRKRLQRGSIAYLYELLPGLLSGTWTATFIKNDVCDSRLACFKYREGKIEGRK